MNIFLHHVYHALSSALLAWSETLYANAIYYQTEYSGETFQYSWGGLLLAWSDLIQALALAIEPKETR